MSLSMLIRMGGAYKNEGAYWKEGAKSNHYGMHELHSLCVSQIRESLPQIKCLWYAERGGIISLGFD